MRRVRTRFRGFLGNATWVLALILAASMLSPWVQAQGASVEPLIDGALNRARPEVGQILVGGGGCTATLIAPNWALTASHCTGHVTLFWPDTAGRGTFNVDPPTGTRQSFPIERAYSLGYPLGPNDVMLLRLATPVPASLVPSPARIAGAAPPSGSEATIFGYGCNPTTPSRGGQKQVGLRSLRIGDVGQFMTSTILCAGDSGGPAFTGAGTTDGPIFGVNSQFTGSTDIYGDVVRRRTEIVNFILLGEIAGRDDITMSGWCRAPAQALYYGDVDADSIVDGICHEESTGIVRYARGTSAAIVPQGEWRGPFCSHGGAQLHVGDFNGDRRTDLLCIDRRDGRKWVDLSTGDWRAPYGTLDFFVQDPWCTHASAEVHVGDFNADGRSDLLCHDVDTGAKWIDFASTRIDALFRTTDYHNVLNWCSHDTATLLVSDFTGDGRSDILCHTKSNGSLDVKTAKRGDVFGASGYWQDTRIGFCRAPSAHLGAFDMTGDGRAELYCLDPSGGGSLVIAMGDGGVPFRTDVSWSIGGWPSGVTRPTLVGNPASQPWARRR